MPEKLKSRKLYNMIKYAFCEVPLYEKNKVDYSEILESRDILDKICEIPVLEKDDAVINNDKLLSHEAIPLFLSQKLHKETTSGSTGKCMEVYWRKGDYQRSLLSLYVRRKMFYGINPGDKLCYFFSLRKFGHEEVHTERRPGQLGFCKSGLNEQRLKEIYTQMLEFQPKWILGQPSVILLLAQIKQKFMLPDLSSLLYIELTGEMLFENIRKQIQDAFACSIANHYGAMEVNTIAYECPCGKLHLTDSTYTEIIDENGNPLPENEEGDVCITTLENFAMPVIRYRVGDRGKIQSKVVCECGQTAKVLKLTSGRINDYVITREGNRINSYVFVRAVEAVNRGLEQAIKQFTVIQRGYEDFEVKLVLRDLDERIMVEKIFLDNIFQKELKNAKFTFEFYNALFPDNKGKLRYFERGAFK